MPEQSNVVARAARWLVILAALPFIGLSVISMVLPEYRITATRMLVAYTALVLCFFGAIHWGIALRLDASESARNRFLIRVILWWGLVPAAFAFYGLFLPMQYARYWLFVALVVCLLVEAALALRLKLPSWYLILHCILSGIGCVALVAARFYSYY